MVEYILGEYLVEIGKITEEQLYQVLHEQRRVKAQPSLIAILDGIMTVEQVEEVKRIQESNKSRFVDIAVEKEYITSDEAQKISVKRGLTYLVFMQTLVNKNLISLEETSGFLKEFQKRHRLTEGQLLDIKSDDFDSIIPLFLPEKAYKYRKLVGTMVRTLKRMLGKSVYIGRALETNACLTGPTAKQHMSGTGGFADAFSEGDGALLQICSVFAQEKFESFNEDALDSAAELLNSINGLYVSTLSDEGHYLELETPEYGMNLEYSQAEAVYSVPVIIEKKKFYFTVIEHS